MRGSLFLNLFQPPARKPQGPFGALAVGPRAAGKGHPGTLGRGSDGHAELARDGQFQASRISFSLRFCITVPSTLFHYLALLRNGSELDQAPRDTTSCIHYHSVSHMPRALALLLICGYTDRDTRALRSGCALRWLHSCSAVTSVCAIAIRLSILLATRVRPSTATYCLPGIHEGE
jgi:hypothetical protein